MSSRKLVTPRQAESVRQMANDKGVSREEFQTALDNGDVARFLDGLKVGGDKTPRIWQTWLTVKSGTLKTVDEIRIALKTNGCNIGDWANDILGKLAFTVSETEQDVKLVNVSPAELGLKGKGGVVARKDIVEQALKSGLEICSAEDGPQAVLRINGLLNGEGFVIGMEPIMTSGGYWCVLCVENNEADELYLYASNGTYWSVDCRFLFRHRK